MRDIRSFKSKHGNPISWDRAHKLVQNANKVAKSSNEKIEEGDIIDLV